MHIFDWLSGGGGMTNLCQVALAAPLLQVLSLIIPLKFLFLSPTKQTFCNFCAFLH